MADGDPTAAVTCPFQSFSTAGMSCPAGFGARRDVTTDTSLLPLMTLQSLHLHGRHGLVSVKGQIYDVRKGLEGDEVTASSLRPLLGHASVLGHDVSRLAALAKSGSPEDENSLLDQDLSSLTYDELVQLETVAEMFARRFELVAKLAPEDYDAIFSTKIAPCSSCAGTGAASDMNEALRAHVHEVVAEGSVKELRKLVEDNQELVNAPCPRTGLQPLHKAVEAGRLDIVEVLVASAADPYGQAALYDNDTPLQLARRLNAEPSIIAALEGVSSAQISQHAVKLRCVNFGFLRM